VKKKDVVNSWRYLIDKIAELFGKIDICAQLLRMEIVVIKCKLINLPQTIK
jgi:hypothetical protein